MDRERNRRFLDQLFVGNRAAVLPQDTLDHSGLGRVEPLTESGDYLANFHLKWFPIR